MTDYFKGIDPTQIADMTKMGVKNLTEMRWKFRRNPDVLQLLDEQTDLLMKQNELAQANESLKLRVKRGQMADFVAAIQMGGISRVAKDNYDAIILNGILLRHLMTPTGRQIEA